MFSNYAIQQFSSNFVFRKETSLGKKMENTIAENMEITEEKVRHDYCEDLKQENEIIDN